MAKRNANDGSGRGASVLVPLTTATAVPDTEALVVGNKGYATGCFCSAEGTIEIKCIDDPALQLIPITAYKDNIWNIEAVGTGGTVDLANVVLFWQ